MNSFACFFGVDMFLFQHILELFFSGIESFLELPDIIGVGNGRGRCITFFEGHF